MQGQELSAGAPLTLGQKPSAGAPFKGFQGTLSRGKRPLASLKISPPRLRGGVGGGVTNPAGGVVTNSR